MQTISLDSGQTLRYFVDLDEFPAERRSYFTRYQIEAAEIDLTPEALNNRLGGILQFLAEGKLENATTAVTNLLFSFNAIRMQYSPDLYSFGVLLHDIDGQLVTDLSPEGLSRLLTPLQIPVGTLETVLADVKKNSMLTENAITRDLLTVAG